MGGGRPEGRWVRERGVRTYSGKVAFDENCMKEVCACQIPSGVGLRSMTLASLSLAGNTGASAERRRRERTMGVSGC